MIINPDKCKSILINRKGQNLNPQDILIDGKKIESEKSVKLLGINIDDKLNFEEHISTLCKRASAQLNALIRLRNYIGKEEKKAIINSFIYANFNYCPLVWHFCSKFSIQKIENIQKRALRFLLNDLPAAMKIFKKKSGKSTMEIKRLRTLALEIFRTIHSLNAPYMTNLFSKENKSFLRLNDLSIPTRNTVTFGDRSIRCLGPHIWNFLPPNVKNETYHSQYLKSILTLGMVRLANVVYAVSLKINSKILHPLHSYIIIAYSEKNI